jgi:hypothetical protein
VWKSTQPQGVSSVTKFCLQISIHILCRRQGAGKAMLSGAIVSVQNKSARFPDPDRSTQSVAIDAIRQDRALFLRFG